MLILLLVQAGTGLFANDDILIEGPLYSWVSKDTSDWLTSIHRFNFNLLLAVIALHVAAVLFYLLVKRENLIHPMLSGRKQLPLALAGRVPRLVNPWRGLAALVVVGLRRLVVGALKAIGNEKGHVRGMAFSDGASEVAQSVRNSLMARLAGFGGFAELRFDGSLIAALATSVSLMAAS